MEIWKAIPGYEDYEVSDEGNVRSLNYNHTGKVRGLKPRIVKKYYRVGLYKRGKNKWFHVHQLVAMAFLSHIPDGNNLLVDHIDENKLNNKLPNLRIATHRFNISRQERDLPTGVSWNKRAKKYRAQIQINGKKKNLGSFLTPEEASEAYQKALASLRRD